MTRVLIAEDDQDIRELIMLTLSFHGFEAVSAADGQEALERVQDTVSGVDEGGAYDLILLDVRMPRVSGYEACRRLREQQETRETPIIMLSAKGQESEIQTGLDAGANEYILKPFAPDLLIKKINEVLNGK